MVKKNRLDVFPFKLSVPILLLLEIAHTFISVDRDRRMQSGLKMGSYFIGNVKNMIEIPK
jgi:hypothetical protein